MICNKCSEDKGISSFPLRNGKPRKYCKECANEMTRKHYRENKSYYRERNARHKQIIRKFVYNYLSDHPCIECGEDDPVALDFDHQGEKSFNISSFHKVTMSLERVKQEIDKCLIRCSNCHRKKTAKDFGWYSGVM